MQKKKSDQAIYWSLVRNNITWPNKILNKNKSNDTWKYTLILRSLHCLRINVESTNGGYYL